MDETPRPEEPHVDSDDSQNIFMHFPIDLNLDTSSDSDSDDSIDTSGDDTTDSYSPVAWNLDRDSEVEEFEEEDILFLEELLTIERNNRSSGHVHHTHSTHDHRNVHIHRGLEIDHDSSSSSSNTSSSSSSSSSNSTSSSSNGSANDMAVESSRISLPRNEEVYDTTEPPAKVRKLSSPVSEDDGNYGDGNDGETCPICLEVWANSGDHRLVALKCGHLFGFKCVERWIRGKSNSDRCCPTCKSKASIKDIRFIYAKKLVAVDTTELTTLQKQVETVQMEKNQIQMELQTTKLEHRSMALQLDLLRKSLTNNAGGKQLLRRNWRFALDKNLEVWRDGGCRVLAYNCRTYEFYVSQKTTNNLFPGYGVRPVSCIDYKLGPFIPLHPKAIRDVAYSQPTDLLMSVGLDGAVKIVERGIPTTSIQCGMPLWSCAWDHARPNHFYIGAVGGLIMTYDVRNTNAVMETTSTPGDMSPSVSLVSTEFGLLSCQLNSAWLWRSKLTHPLPLKGPFVSLCYDQESKRVAISCRPCNGERAKVVLYKINKNVSNEVSFDFVETMLGSSRSTVMSRPAFVKCADSAWVAAYSESDSSLLLHSLDGSRTMSLPAAEAALDVCAGQVNGDTILAALSDSRLRLYKSYPTNSYSQ